MPSGLGQWSPGGKIVNRDTLGQVPGSPRPSTWSGLLFADNVGARCSARLVACPLRRFVAQ